MTTPGRRWSFSLRTLFVVVTVLGCWLGYQLNWIRERRAFIGDEAPSTAITTGCPHGAVLASEKAPWQIRLFGETGIEAIWMDHQEPIAGDPYIKALFPEARVYWKKPIAPDHLHVPLPGEVEAPDDEDDPDQP